MDKYEKQNRINEALNIRGMKQVELVEQACVPKSSLSNYIRQRWQPKQKPLYAMARVLDVSEMWLAGYDVPMERTVDQKKLDELTELISFVRDNEEFRDLCISLYKLNPEQMSIVKNMIFEFMKINRK